MALEAFKYKRGELLVLDQLKLPHCHEYIQVKTTEDGWQVINKMQVKIHSPVKIKSFMLDKMNEATKNTFLGFHIQEIM